MIRTVISALTAAAACAFAQPSGTSPHTPPANGPRRADPTWVALRDCTVHVNPGEAIEHATVVFRDGVIQAVMPGEGAPIPMGPRVVQSTGLHVYPAFIDAYVDVDAPAPTPGAPGVHWNASITPQRRVLDGSALDAATGESLRKLGFGAAAVAPRGGIFRGTSAVVSLSKASDDPSITRPLVYRADAYQAVGFESARGGYPGSLMGAIAVVRQTLSDADWLDTLPEGAQRNAAIQNDGCLGALSRRYDAVTPLVFDVGDELDALRAAKVVREFGRRAMILGSGTEFRRLEAIASEKLPYVLPLNYPRQPDVSTLGKVEQVELRELMTWEQAPTNPHRLANAGVSFALTSSKARDRDGFIENVRKAITCGLTEEQALAALTTVPAKMLMVDDQIGTVEVGKRANLLVTDGPVFGKETKVHAVWIDGKAHDLYTAPERLEGEWALEIPGAPEAKRKLVVEKGNGITVHRDDKASKASRVSVEGGRVSFTFEHEPLDGKAGVYAMTAAIERDADGKAARLLGQGLRATGETFTWTAARESARLDGLWPTVFDQPHADGAKNGAMLVIADGKLAMVGAAEAPDMPVEHTWDGRTLRYELDPARTGHEGIVKVEATVDFDEDPPVMRGVVNAPSGGSFTWTATRTSPQGKWNLSEYDGEAKKESDPGYFTIEVTGENATVTLAKTSEGEAEKAEEKPAAEAPKPDDAPKTEPDAETPKPEQPGAAPPREGRGRGKFGGARGGEGFKIEGRVVAFKQDMSALGGEGKADATLRVFGDTLVGEFKLAEVTHTFRASREPRKKDDSETEWAKDIPESLPTPFGPYGLESLPPQCTFVFTNATIWTNGPEGVIRGGTLVVSNGKIAGVFPTGNTGIVPPGPDAITIDCQGKHITAGIIDCHSHTGISRGVNEGGQAVTAEVRIEDVTNPDTTNWYWQLAGGVTAVNNLHGSANAIGGQSQTNKIRWGCARPDDMHFEGAIPGIKFALGENPRGANSGPSRDLGGGATARYPQTRMGVEMLIRDRFTAASEYKRRLDEEKKGRTQASTETPGGGLEEKSTNATLLATLPVRRDFELEALAEILDGKRLVHCHSYRQDEILMLCLVAKEYKFKIGTFQHILEGYKVADYVRDYSGGGSGFSDWWAYKVEVQDAIPQGLPLMAQVGATMSFNSDSDELARRLNVEAGKAVKYVGLSEEDALKFVTLNPAKQLRVDDRVGSIEVGKDADFAVWNGPPLSSLSLCEMTFVDGRRLFSLEDDAKHREKIQQERSRLIQKILAEKKRPGAGDGDRPAGGPPDGARRRPGGGRRPPNDDLVAADFLVENLTEEEAARVREYYLDLMNRGKSPNQPGMCGCGLMHW
ncbi:hypothetical protein PHYC_00334 [Phycisphaerales bacterium]|nr:hypothetical protein PHYC_00334 [Phycisphaerales bacterium]